jgi:hypothetical protein
MQAELSDGPRELCVQLVRLAAWDMKVDIDAFADEDIEAELNKGNPTMNEVVQRLAGKGNQ